MKATFRFVPLVRSACPINPWLARFAFVALRKIVPKLDPSRDMLCEMVHVSKFSHIFYFAM